MATRKPYKGGYGSVAPPKSQTLRAPAPGPPDGKPPVRLPIGEPGVTGDAMADDDILQRLLREGDR